jgi:hypothetical protein
VMVVGKTTARTANGLAAKNVKTGSVAIVGERRAWTTKCATFAIEVHLIHNLYVFIAHLNNDSYIQCTVVIFYHA